MIIEIADHAPCKDCGKTASFKIAMVDEKGQMIVSYTCDTCGASSLYEVSHQ